MSDIKYTPGRLFIEIDGIRLTCKGYCGGASVQAEQRAAEKRHAILQRIADTYDSENHLADKDQLAVLQAENAKLRTCVEELLDFVPYEKPELGPLPNWICEIKARAEAALTKARVE